MDQDAGQAVGFGEDAADLDERGILRGHAAAVAVAVDLDQGGDGRVGSGRGVAHGSGLRGAVQQHAQGDPAAQ